MPAFEYTAKTAGGKEVSGVVQADSETSVVRTLDERSLFPVRIREQTAPSGRRRGGRIRLRDVGVMYGQLADLLRAGVPTLRALETLVRAGLRDSLARVVLSVRDEVAEGKSMADAVAAHPEAFTSLHAAMIRAGEQAGFLEDVLANLSAFIERADELRGKVRGSLIYPVVLAVIGSFLIVGILIGLVPQFKPFFQGMPLPIPTVVLFALSDLFREHLLVLVSLVLLTALGVRTFVRSEFGRSAWSRWQLKIPVVGRIIRMVSITRFCRILGTMLANGVPIIQALNISKEATGSDVLARAIAEATEAVRAGDPLAEPLKRSGLFPPAILEMIAVAEESNQMERVLVQTADTVDRRTNRQVDQAVRLIEPLMLLLMATAIGFVAVGLLYPIFTISQTLL